MQDEIKTFQDEVKAVEEFFKVSPHNSLAPMTQRSHRAAPSL